MSPFPTSIKKTVEALLGQVILEQRPIGGGSINEAYLIKTADHSFFLKYNTGDYAPALFHSEVKGLELLNAQGIRTPQIYNPSIPSSVPSFLLMEYILPGEKTDKFWIHFGQSLAEMHRVCQAQFGLDHDNFIGRLPQSNKNQLSWNTFFQEERILPQLEMALQDGLLQEEDRKSFVSLFARLPEIFPMEPPSLTHGDLWSGNFLAATEGEVVLIDPAVCFAHREMDLAMTHLFGGFPTIFYHSYKAQYPLAPGFKNRMEIYQLYYLMVHVNLFGGGYVGQVRNILGKHGFRR